MVSDRFRLRYRLVPEHFQAYSKLAAKRSASPLAAGRSSSKWRWSGLLGGLALGIVIGAVLSVLKVKGVLAPEQVKMLGIGALFGSLAVIALYAVAYRRISGHMVGAHDAVVGEFSLVAYEGGGIQVSGKHLQTSYDWTAFLDLTQSQEIMVLWVDRGVGIILPFKAFSSVQEKQDFADFAKGRIAASRQSA